MILFLLFRAQRILELEKRIKAHTQHMHERRKLPKGSPQKEMDAARKELEVVSLHVTIDVLLIQLNFY